MGIFRFNPTGGPGWFVLTSMHPMNAVTPPRLAENPAVRGRIPLRLKCLVAMGLALLGGPAGAQTTDLEIGVRSKVMDGFPKWNKDKTEAEGGHDMIYGILAVKQVDNVRDLVRPVDEKRVASLLMDTLDANGFREFVIGETPDIIIVASYGRGEMTNPYIRDTGEVVGAAGVPSPTSALNLKNPEVPPPPNDAGSPVTLAEAPPTQTITGAAPQQLFDEKQHGYEAKLQKAAYEKLFIRITAFEYPKGPKDKPHMLWKTIVVVDDPDHRDLNQMAQAMLEAAGPYFDKMHRAPEVELRRKIPDGHVKVGQPVIREPLKPKISK